MGLLTMKLYEQLPTEFDLDEVYPKQTMGLLGALFWLGMLSLTAAFWVGVARLVLP